ncbi:hypothetical protein ACJ72_07478 [Emergomyces africanus]|uniref:Uncharacterized protein n=1 Tax=Emergomyces africanus TaxID=1955775 RepID=A0A1B7NNK4_9EURO|nr:hypothetical protein ACJ72_07478 [Emergomyces africanus]
MKKSSHEVIYSTLINLSINLLKLLYSVQDFKLYVDISETLNFTILIIKRFYDQVYKTQYFTSKNKILM